MATTTSLYLRTAETLRSRFRLLPPETLVPSEPVLQAELEVSRATLRHALDILEREGVIKRQRGRGTYTHHRRLVHNLSGLSSWTDQLRATAVRAGTRSLRVSFETAPPRVVELGMPESEEVMVIDRVRLADGVPISWMQNYLPKDLAENLRVVELQNGSLYEALRLVGVQLVRAEDVVTAELSGSEASERLEIAVGDPVLCTARRSWNEVGRLAEVGFVVSAAHRYEYRVSLEGRTEPFVEEH